MKLKATECQNWRGGRPVIRSLSTFQYNCVGMIFASRRAWIEIDQIYRILKEDGYREIGQDQVAAGDVVLYKDAANEPTHVGLVIASERLPMSQIVNIKVLSKWGLEAEFIHFVEDVLEWLGKPSEYYTERPYV